MKKERSRLALMGLQWSLGLVVLVESFRFISSAAAAHAFAKTGLPDWVRVFLGCTEILAALLFLVPRTLVTGGYSLAAVFILAIVVHLLHGWFDIGGLLVYTAAALAVTAYKADRQKREV
jgi:hypothetical protein